MSIQDLTRPTNMLASEPLVARDGAILNEAAFEKMIARERKRSERSRKPFLLTLIDAGTSLPSSASGLKAILSALTASTRETDITGWYKQHTVIGVMFTEINLDEKGAVIATLMGRISLALRDVLSLEQFSQINIAFHVFPEEWNRNSEGPANSAFYPDVRIVGQNRRSMLVVKRLMDIAGSLLAIAIFAPLFLAIALAIRISSNGPVLFRQRRLGHHGMAFDLLKFRSMYVNNDATIHEEYVKKLVAGTADKQPSNGNGKAVYKLTSDPRITKVGNLLRRSSLDELPQFINVLKGEMSLVGPRPPLSYEVEAYDLWHRRRLLEVKPGITGLWQVNGRNRLKFDEMVRLDLAYAKTWTPWLDLKILMRTPLAVVEGAN